MTRNSRFVAGSMVVAFALGIALAAVVVAQAPPPGLGTWTLNVVKSKFSPGPAAKSGSATFTAVGSSIKAVVDTVTGDGQKVHWEYTAALDGKPAPVTSNPDGDTVVAKLINPTTIETSYTLKGKPTTVNTRVYSADGKTMTVTSVGTNGQGVKINNVQVFEKR